MGKQNKRNRRRRDDAMRWPARNNLEQANADVLSAERVLLEARRRAAGAAAARNGHSAPASPEEQAEAFFTRPGDFYIAQFEIDASHLVLDPQSAPETKVRAQCVLKADEAQRDYLVEVMRQIRGAFGEHARISLSRAQQTQQRVVDPRVVEPHVGRVHAAAREALRRRTAQHNCEHGPTAGNLLGPASTDPPNWRVGGPPDRDLTRAELQAQLPGMTRAEVATDLGIDPADIGGDIKGAGDIDVEQLAAELGISPLDLMPIDVRGGGRVYAVKPRQTQPPAGRHAAPDGDTRDNAPGGAP